jgi:hypothetical protein
MKTYNLLLKGTKGNNTIDLNIVVKANNKLQAFFFAYQFFIKGEINVIYGTKKTGLASIHKYIPEAEELKKYVKKYKIYKSCIN